LYLYFIKPKAMKYKILKDTPLFNSLVDMLLKMKECKKAAGDLVGELGGTGEYIPRVDVLSGGIEGIAMENRPEGWSRAYPNHYSGLYFPQRRLKQNKEVLQKIDALPVVEKDYFNSLVNFKQQTVETGRKIKWLNNPGIDWKKELILIDVDPDAKYTPAAGMIEVTMSEYKALQLLPSYES
jgi:hypothetical protein